MRSFSTFASGSLLLALATVVTADTVLLCETASYADGGIYCRKNSAGTCVADLGDFPAKKTFVLDMTLDSDKSLHIVEKTGYVVDPSTNAPHNTYNKYSDMLYLDASPGAFHPLGFVVDNSTLKEGQTTYSWWGAYGIMLWSPTGNPVNGTPNDAGTVSGQGFQWVDVPGYPGLQQIYWNETKWQEVHAGNAGAGSYFVFCYGDYDSIVTPSGPV